MDNKITFTLPSLDDSPYTNDGSENAHFELTGWPFYWLTQTNGQYLFTLEKALRNFDLDIPTWRVLMLLEPSKYRSISNLAKESSVKLSTMTRIVKRMQKDNLVVTRRRPTDARVTEVGLTVNGKRARPLAWQQVGRIYDIAFDGMSPEMIASLQSILQRIVDNFSNYENEAKVRDSQEHSQSAK